MSIKERKLREVGNSVVLTISKEFLKKMVCVPETQFS